MAVLAGLDQLIAGFIDEEGAVSQGMQQPLEARKGWSLQKETALSTAGLSPGRLVGLQFHNCQIFSMCCFTKSFTKLVVICYGNHRRLIEAAAGTGRCGSQACGHRLCPHTCRTPAGWRAVRDCISQEPLQPASHMTV